MFMSDLDQEPCSLAMQEVVTLFECNDKELDTVIDLANLTYGAETYMYDLHPSDENACTYCMAINP
jgi:hypothetical protein